VLVLMGEMIAPTINSCQDDARNRVDGPLSPRRDHAHPPPVVGVVGSSPIAPTKFGRKKEQALGGDARCLFFWRYGKSTEKRITGFATRSGHGHTPARLGAVGEIDAC